MTIPCLLPPTPLADPSRDGVDSCCTTVYDPDTLAVLLTTNPSRAAAQIGRLNIPQRLCQALEHVCWHEHLGRTCSIDDVLAEWQRLVTSIQSNDTPVPMTVLALQLAADPFDAVTFLVALPLTQRVAAAQEHAHWLSLHGLSRTVDEVLNDWQALAAHHQVGERRRE